MDSLLQLCVCILLSGTFSYMTVPSNEVIQNIPKVIVVRKNSALVLNCTDPSLSWITDSNVNYTWFKDGQALTLNRRRITVKQNGSLYFQSVKKKKRKQINDEGQYECHVTLSAGTVIARRVWIQIARISKTFIKNPKNQTTVPGGVSRFECQVKATAYQVRYIWNKDGKQLQANDRFTELPMGVLQIHNVQQSDKGVYSCSALNTFSNLQGAMPFSMLLHSKEAVLNVLNSSSVSQARAPRVTAASAIVNATLGDSVTMECQADGNPEPHVVWQKFVNLEDESRWEPIEDRPRVRRVGVSNLKITKVMDTDGGLYRCVASGPGFANSNAEVTLNINYPPTLVTIPDSGDHTVAKRFRLHCSAQGQPIPTITWFHNGQRLQEDAGHIMFKNNNKQLVLESRISDSGFYQCIGENSYGSETGTARIHITLGENAPHPPRKAKATPVSDSQINLSWLPSVCCDVFVYTVHYSWVIPDTKVKQSKQLVEQSNQCEIRQLLPYTTYHFYVRAYNKNGSSEKSKEVTATTLQSVPSAAPRIQTSSLSVGSITLSWSPLLKSEKRGEITRYRIYSQLQEEDSEQVEEIHNDTLLYTIKGLLPDKMYKVRVLAGTKVGYPVLTDDKWPWVFQRTLSKNSTTAVILVPQLEVVPLNKSAVQVSWQIANSSFKASGYELHIVRKIGTTQRRHLQLPKESNSTVINHLENRIYYEAMLEVLGENETLGRAVHLFQVRSPDQNPEPPPPMDVWVVAKSPHTVSLNWTKPDWEEGIRYYTVCYHRSNDDRKIMYERSDTQNHTLQDLSPYTMYTISVRSHSPQTTGPFSTTQFITTLEDVPSSPEDVTLYAISEDEVKLMWNPPTKRNGIIMFYIIQYHPHQNDPDFLWSSMHSTKTQAVLRDLTGTVYYFKLSACTTAGQGPPSNVVKVVLSPCVTPCEDRNSTPPVSTLTGGSDDFLSDQRLGIVIGCAIGLTSIIICIMVIVLRQRHYANLYTTRTATNPSLGYRYQKQGYQVSERRRLMQMEGQNKDSGSVGVFMSGNGEILAMSSKNKDADKLAAESEQEAGENACLMWHQRCLHHADGDGNKSLSNDSGASLSCDIRGVSPESSSERHADSTWGSMWGNPLSGENSGAVSNVLLCQDSNLVIASGDKLDNVCRSDELLKKMLHATSVNLQSPNRDISCKVYTPNHHRAEEFYPPNQEAPRDPCTPNQVSSTELCTENHDTPNQVSSTELCTENHDTPNQVSSTELCTENHDTPNQVSSTELCTENHDTLKQDTSDNAS
ncbi:protogenin-like isoform X2 [Ostrea edulis]|uniref:protogenin-like isoform X2 n=1 Tax=Ostrea edulis TaxID=37623 RepID=UPI0024AF593D|nr:protogenin-like isoform X2 [Ostrea edulis]